jgi:uncharacterized protein (TIGR00255 family)
LDDSAGQRAAFLEKALHAVAEGWQMNSSGMIGRDLPVLAQRQTVRQIFLDRDRYPLAVMRQIDDRKTAERELAVDRREMPDATPLSVNETLRWPGMFGDQGMDFSTLGPEVMALAREALEDFTATRGREGEKLAETIVDRVNAMRDIVRKVVPRIPEAQALYTEKLRQRLTEALGNASDDRILQEVAVFATRIDVAEELTRLNTHLDEVERVLKQGGACGKRLDFLMQELNREANTLGSKSAITEVSQASMELKLLIEQMREQIQNLE